MSEAVAVIVLTLAALGAFWALPPAVLASLVIIALAFPPVAWVLARLRDSLNPRSRR